MIEYAHDRTITVDQFIDLLNRSTLAERRPVHSRERIQKMLQRGNILITAWQDDLLVGVSRGLSDFAFCTYLSDLAVDVSFQKQGIGKELIRRTYIAGSDDATLILLAAPKAQEYYPKVGMDRFDHCFLIPRKNN
jgi:ribosomal protein S18 acetylase RimI-like enzyme